MLEEEIEKLKGHIPLKVLEELPTVIKTFNITTSLRLGHFLSQMHHESSGFRDTKENLNYSAEGLLKTFPKYFKSLPGSRNINYYARNPERIANLVYANRMGNGNEASGDGWKHRGFGYLQLTGKYNQYAFADFITNPKIKSNPELIATEYPLASGAFFFTINKLWLICDLGDTEEVVKRLTKAINGGYNGLEDRISWFCFYMKLLKG